MYFINRERIEIENDGSAKLVLSVFDSMDDTVSMETYDFTNLEFEHLDIDDFIERRKNEDKTCEAFRRRAR